jgi:hypothetical protein
MAQKRMFDKAIIDTDRFMDLPISAKALYFLLGMEADDEGFVSSKKVIRIHGGNDDDIKILSLKGFTIPFDNGVLVITEWHKNNWLDSRRSRPTEYVEERKLLQITEDRRYVLSDGLASIEERSIEENRIEERERTPKEKAQQFFSDTDSQLRVVEWLIGKGYSEQLVKSEVAKFVSYWTEPNGSGTKQRWQMEPVFDIQRRFQTWFSRIKQPTNGGGRARTIWK